MKKLVLILIIAYSGTVFAQGTVSNYNVIQVNGDIFNVTNSQKVSQGNVLKPKDQLNFKTNSFAYVISSARQKFLLRNPSNQTTDQDILAYAELALSPIRSRGQLSTRGVVGESGVKDFKTYLGNENFNVIGDQLDILMDKNRYPLNNDKFIVFHYKINGKDVSKKVGFNDQVLRIEKLKLQSSQNNTTHSDTLQAVSVYTYSPSTKESELVSKVNLQFIDPAKLRNELLTAAQVLKQQNASPDEIKNYLFQYVFDIYGNIDEGQLKAFIDGLGLE